MTVNSTQAPGAAVAAGASGPPRRAARSSLASALLFAGLAGACGAGGGDTLSQAELKDPVSCQSCHPAQFDQWSRSMHAYAADDPIFIAMNQRGQRETKGALGDFCVKCHAPVAQRDGLTTDGHELATLPAAARGVTCFFCHSAASIDGTHNNPLTLATDGRLFGPIVDPVAGATHKSVYSALFDDTQAESAAACGGCHDIVNQHQVALERTFQEWQGTLFAVQPHGQSCIQCHMAGSDGPASTVSTRSRRLHNHEFPAVDLPLTAFAGAAPDAQRRNVQAMLDTVLQGTICVDDVARKIVVALDNVAAGHSWPSGASQDRRAWADVTAYVGDTVVYKSGVAAGEALEAAPDPDLWMIRDCIFDGAGAETHMFWDAASQTTNLLPGPVMTTVSDPTSFARTHQKREYPVAAPLTASPDRVTLAVYLQALGDDVLQSLVDSQDLDPAVARAVPRYQLGGGATLEWTRVKATPYLDTRTGDQLACVTIGKYTPVASIAAATSHARCAP